MLAAGANGGCLDNFFSQYGHHLFYITVKYHQNILNGIPSYRADTKMFMDRRIKRQTTDGCQAHCYIPQTFQLGDKKVDVDSRKPLSSNSCSQLDTISSI